MRLKIGNNTSIALHCRFTLCSKIYIGNNTVINQECYLDGRGTMLIGNNVNIGRRACIYTAQHDYNSPHFNYTEKKVEIYDNVWIASNVVIIPGIKINEGAVIAAGAVVTKDVDAYTVVGGNPAKFIKERNRNIKYKTNWAQLFY